MIAHVEDANPVKSSPRLLRLGDEQSGKDAEGEGGRKCSACDHHAAACCWVSTEAIFRQPSILRNLIYPVATRRKSRITAASWALTGLLDRVATASCAADKVA